MFISRGLKALGGAVIPILIFSQTAIASPTLITYQQTSANGPYISASYTSALGSSVMLNALIKDLIVSEANVLPIFVTDSNRSTVDYENALLHSENYGTALTDPTYNQATAPTAAYSMNIDGTLSSLTSNSAVTVNSVSAVNGTITVTLSSAPTVTPPSSDFKVMMATTTDLPTAVTPTGISQNGAVVTLTVPVIADTATAQTIVYSVSYQNGTAMSATVINSINVANCSAIMLPTMTDGSAYTVTATVEDDNGDGVSGIATNAFTMTVGNGSVITGTAIPLTNGQYSITFIPTNVPTSALLQVATLNVNGVAIYTRNVTVSAGSNVTTTTTAIFPSVSVLNTGAPYTIYITPKDALGNPTTLGTPTVTLGTGSTAVTLVSVPGPAVNGVYPVTITAPATATSAAAKIYVSLAGSNLPLTSSGTYSVVGQTAATMSVDFSGLPSTLLQGGSYTIPITLDDVNGLPVTLPTLATNTFPVSFAGATLTQSSAPVASTTPGVYNVTFIAANGNSNTLSKLTVAYSAASLTQVSTASYTEGGSTSAVAVSSAIVAWPTATTLTAGTAYTATVTVADSNGNPVSGLAAADFGVQQGTFSTSVTTPVTSVVPGSVAGSYTVTFTPTAGSNQTFELGIISAGASTQFGTTYTATVQGTTSAVTLPATMTNGVLIAGQPVTIPVTVSNCPTNLTASSFALSYNSLPLTVTNVTYASANTYSLTFNAPSTLNTTGATLSINAAGVTGTSAGVTVNSQSAIIPTLTVAAATASLTTGGVTYPKPTDSMASLMQATYNLVTVGVASGGNSVFGLPASAFTVALGSGTTAAQMKVVAVVPDMTTAGTYDLVAQTGLTAVSPAAAAYVTVNGVAGHDNNANSKYTVVVGTPVSYNTKYTYPTGNLAGQLTSGQTYTMTASVADSRGVPVVGYAATNFALGYAATTGAPLLTALPTSGVTVTEGTPGTYTINFTPTTANLNPKYMGVLVNSAGGATVGDTIGAGVFNNIGNKTFTVVAGVASQVVMTPNTHTVVGGGSQVFTLTLKDANNNAVTTGSDANDVITVTLTGGATPDAGTLTGSTTTSPADSSPVSVTVNLSGGVGTFTYNEPATAVGSGTGTITFTDTTHGTMTTTTTAALS